MYSIARTLPSRHDLWSTTLLNCSIFITDIVGYGDPRRDDHDRATLRSALLRILTDAFAESGLSWHRCRHHDRGDGLLTIVPLTLSTTLLVDPLLQVLGEGLHRHNRESEDRLRMRLRSALPVGPVRLHGTGYPNAPVIHAARMLNSAPLRRSLAMTDIPLAAMVSSYVYENVVWHRRGALAADAFRRTRYQAKGMSITSWMYLTQPNLDQAANEGGWP